MAERAAAWVDGLFPHVAVRQWVLTVPFRRRWLLARRPELDRGVLAIALRLVTRWLREQTGAPDGKCCVARLQGGTRYELPTARSPR